MNDSGRKRPLVAGEPASLRLMKNLDYRLSPNVQPLDESQVALVLRALADHTALHAALAWDPSGPGYPYANESSVGRWFHAVADDLEGMWG